MFGSDKRSGFLTGTPGGAVTRTPTKKPASMMPRSTPPSNPVTSLPNPVVGPAPRAVTRSKPDTSAATVVPRVIRDRFGDQKKGTGSMPAPKSILASHGMPVVTPGRGLWSNFNSQVTPGKWFSK